MVLEIPGGLFGQDDVRETTTTPVVTGTTYWSASGLHFSVALPSADIINYSASKGSVFPGENGRTLTCAVLLPHGAVVTAITVYGQGGTYILQRNNFAGGTKDDMASANIGTEDTSISNATIDNSAYQYWITANSVSTNEEIYGVKITYTI